MIWNNEKKVIQRARFWLKPTREKAQFFPLVTKNRGNKIRII